MRFPLAFGLSAALMAACGPLWTTTAPAERLLAPTALQLEPAAYFDAAWVSAEVIALARPGPGRTSRIVLITTSGQQVGEVPRWRPAGCDGQIFSALSRFGGSKLAFAEICEADATGDTESTFLAFDPVTRQIRDLGRASEPPKIADWLPDGSAGWYTAEGSLCATIYEHRIGLGGGSPFDGPSSVTVSAQGRSFPLGEDLAAAPDRCTKFARSDYPVAGSAGELSAFVSFAGDKGGQERIDLPWALVSVRGGQTESVLDGVIEPRGLGVATDGTYVFAGQVGGLVGLWRIRPDGSGLTRLDDAAPSLMVLSPDARSVLGILLPGLSTTPPDTDSNVVVTYDLSQTLESG